MNLKDVCDADSDALMQEISNSLNAEVVKLLAAIIKNSRNKPRGKWNFEKKKKKKKRLYLYLSVAHNPIFFLRRYSLFHKDAPCNPFSIPFILGPAMPMF